MDIKPLFFPVVILFFCLDSLFAQQLTMTESKAMPIEGKTLIIAIDNQNPPFTYLNNHRQPAGIFVDIWKLWSKKTGVDIRFLASNWNETLSNLKDEKTDIHSGLFYNSSRAKWMNFSRPLYQIGSYLFYNHETRDFDCKTSLAGKRIGVLQDSFAEDYLRTNFKDAEVVPYLTRKKMLQSVMDQQSDAILEAGYALKTVIHQSGLAENFEACKEPLFEKTFYAGVLKNNHAFLSVVENGLNLISQEEFLNIEASYIENPEKRYFKGPGSQINFTKQEKDWLAKEFIVRARVATIPPLHFYTSDFRGISVDYLKLISERAGFKVEFVKGDSWSQALEDIRDHKNIDLILTAKNDPERQKDMIFTNDYLFMPWVIYSKDNAEYIGGVDDLNGRKVAVEKNFVMHHLLKQRFPDLILVVEETSLDALKAVATGKADAYIGNLTTSSYLIQKENLNNLKIAAPTPFGNHNQAMAIRNDWPELAGIIDKTLKSITQEEHAAIRSKWLSIKYEYGINKWDVFKWVAGIAFISLMILSVTLIWNRKLNLEIKNRIEAEEQVKLSLKEKETLLQEIHHRVKNNMQVVASLLKLQLMKHNDENIDSVLKETIGRVYSMAAIHDNLHRSDKLSEIDFKPYLTKLTQMLGQTYTIDHGKVRFKINTSDIKLGIDQANPLGLVLNELISNSLKYAFPDNQQGCIEISGELLENREVQISVADDGVGLPDDFDWDKTSSLGLKLTRDLVEKQLNGFIEVDNKKGTKITIRFSLESGYHS